MTVEYVENASSLSKVSSRPAMWEDKMGGGDGYRTGPYVKPVLEIHPASHRNVAAVEDRRLSWVAARIDKNGQAAT